MGLVDRRLLMQSTIAVFWPSWYQRFGPWDCPWSSDTEREFLLLLYYVEFIYLKFIETLVLQFFKRFLDLSSPLAIGQFVETLSRWTIRLYM
jgi:hypothetical protein